MIRYRTDPMEVEAFTSGDCWRLALTLRELYGFPVAFLGEHSADKSVWGMDWYHAFVALPDGRYLDIEGISTAEELLEKWAWKDNGNEGIVVSDNDAVIDSALNGQMSFYEEDWDAFESATNLVEDMLPEVAKAA